MPVRHEELWERWRRSHDLAARDQLVESYLWLIRYVAGRLMVGLPPQYDQGDLEGHGAFGLLEAIERYDPSRGVRFETYAIPWIRGACFEGIRALQWAPTLRRRVKQLERAQDELRTTLGREPTRQEVAAHLGLTLEELEERENEVGTLSVLSLDEIVLDDSSLADRLADPEAVDPAEASYRAQRREVLTQAIESLPEQERLVISLFYNEGLLGKEIAEILGLSPARISQVHSKAILRLRGKLSRLKRVLVS